jgi:hypothetical protein
MGRFSSLFGAVLVLTLPCISGATTYLIRPDGMGDFASIQEAITAAVDGDVIELVDGIFMGNGNRDIDYLGKAITVRSQSGNPESCIIECDGDSAANHRGFAFLNGEQDDSILEEVTVRNGYIYEVGAERTPQRGAGDLCPSTRGSAGRVEELLPPMDDEFGGGVACGEGASPTLRGCVF